MQNNDPYLDLINIMRVHGSENNSPAITIGEVIVPPPNLKVKVGDLQLDKDNLLISDYLLQNYKRACNIQDNENIQDETNNKWLTLTDTLRNGDKLAMFSTQDGQLYIILSRLVKLP